MSKNRKAFEEQKTEDACRSLEKILEDMKSGKARAGRFDVWTTGDKFNTFLQLNYDDEEKEEEE